MQRDDIIRLQCVLRISLNMCGGWGGWVGAGKPVRRLLKYSRQGKVALVSGPVWKSRGGEKAVMV